VADGSLILISRLTTENSENAREERRMAVVYPKMAGDGKVFREWQEDILLLMGSKWAG